MSIRMVCCVSIFIGLLACGKSDAPEGPQLVLDRSALQFGQEFGNAVFVGTSKEENLMIQNPGTAPLTVQSVDAQLPPEFVMQLPEKMTVEPRGRTFIRFFFTPSEAKRYTGSIVIHSDAANEPTKTVELSGVGVAPMADGGM